MLSVGDTIYWKDASYTVASIAAYQKGLKVTTECGKSLVISTAAGKDKKNLNGKAKGVCPECGKDPCICKGGKSCLGIEEGHEPGKEAEKGKKGFPEMDEQDTLEEVQHTKAFAPHEVGKLGEAAGFAKELVETSDFNDEHRQKSYHFHKSLEPIGAMTEQDHAVNIEEPTSPTEEDIGGESMQQFGKEMDGSMGSMEASAPQMSYEQKMVGCKKSIQAASKYFKDLSQTHAFTDAHRGEAAVHAKALDAAAQMEKEDAAVGATEGGYGDEGITPVPESDVIPEPGEMGQKNINGLKAAVARNARMMQEMTRKLAKLQA